MFHCQRRGIPCKDFTSDIRSNRDARDIISSAKIAIASREEDITSLVKRCMSLTVPHPKIWNNVCSGIVKNGNLRRWIQGQEDGSASCDWIVTFASHSSVSQRLVSILILRSPTNFGSMFDGVSLFALVLTPEQGVKGMKETKSALETSLSLATLFSDREFRIHLQSANDVSSFNFALCVKDTISRAVKSRQFQHDHAVIKEKEKILNIWTGVRENFLRRAKFYPSDITDGFTGRNTISKVLATTLFMYFLCILPTVALGVLNASNTHGKLDANRALMGEAIGGLLFSLFAGQPFVVIATTAPLSLCNQIIHDLSITMDVDFYSLYGCIGMFNSLFLIMYGVLGLNSLINFSTRSVEELFLAFSVICFASSGISGFVENFEIHYHDFHLRSVTVLFLLLLLCTVAVAMMLMRFKFSRFLAPNVRETLSDYAIPASVLVTSMIAAFVFKGIPIERYPVDGRVEFRATRFEGLTPAAIAISAALGFAVSILFFMDQGISAQLVNTPCNNLKKGNANDLDFILVALINIITSVFGLPWMNGLLPHSPLHVMSLADWVERIRDGRVERVIVHVRETRVAIILCHILILLTVTCFPRIFSYIPVPVLSGLFIYCAIASTQGNSFFDRLSLLMTQQSQYPPNHYVRKVEQRKIHLFTLIQVMQLVILSVIGIAAPWPFVRMLFPLLIALSIPFRHKVMPFWIKEQDLQTLDSYK